MNRTSQTPPLGSDPSPDAFLGRVEADARPAAHTQGPPPSALDAPDAPDRGSGDIESPDPRIGGEREAAVLEALDPFWTRGIIMRRPPQG